MTATKGWSRPTTVIQVHCRERPLPDRKADIAYKAIIVRRSKRRSYSIARAKGFLPVARTCPWGGLRRPLGKQPGPFGGEPPRHQPPLKEEGGTGKRLAKSDIQFLVSGYRGANQTRSGKLELVSEYEEGVSL